MVPGALTNIYQQVISNLGDEGGVIICHVGLVHAHRLAVHLHEMVTFKTEAIYCYSDFGHSDIDEDIHSIRMKVDSDIIQALYLKIPFIPLHLHYKTREELLDSPELNAIMESFIAYQKDG